MIEGRMNGKDIIMRITMHVVDAEIALDVFYQVLHDKCFSYLELCEGIGVAEVAQGCSAEQGIPLARAFPVIFIRWLAEIVGLTGKQVVDALGGHSEDLALGV